MFWTRVKEHKVIQWGIAYLGAALALAHGAELIAHAFHWPDVVWRSVMITLVVGFPIAITIAWYHGHKGLQQVTAGELSIVAVLGLIGAVFFTAALRPAAEHDAVSPTVGARQAAAANDPGPAAEIVPAPPPGAGARQPNSLAVVPFVSNSPEADQEHFVDGLTSELINSLNRIPGLAVTGRTSSFAFKDTNEDLRTIGERLGVEYVLEGSAQKSGERIRIATQLVDARTERQLWSETYDRAFDDIFAIQDEITTQVAEGLQITLGVGDLGSLPGMTRNFAAYEEYLVGRGLVWGEGTPESLRRAIEHLERAIVRDESFAWALLRLADAYYAGAFQVPEMAEEWRAKAQAAVDRARALAPDSPLLAVLAAEEAMDRGEWSEAARFYETEYPALARRYAAAFPLGAEFAQGRLLVLTGRSSDAVGYLERTRASEPLSNYVALILGDAYAAVGALDASLAELDRGLTVGETQFLLGTAMLTALATGDRDEIERRLPADPGNPNRAIARFLDDPAGGAAEVRRLAAELPADAVLARNVLGHWAAYYGDPETALTLVREPIALWRPIFADMRKLEGFKDLVREKGFLDYWREYGWSDFCRPVGEDDFECE
jgi:TolB-like protein